MGKATGERAFTATKSEIPDELLAKWQGVVNLMAKIIGIPAGLIMKIDPAQIEVIVASSTESNPYEKGERADLNTGLYCETVMAQRSHLLVPDALKDPEWDHNPDVKLGMISYLGFPLIWPDGVVFGTICVLDAKENHYSGIYRELISQFKDLIEIDLAHLYHGQELQEEITVRKRAEKALEKQTHDLGERVKELNCLYGISGIIENQELRLEEMLQAIVELIPPSWQYPEITCARITLNSQEFVTGNFRETAWKQTHDITVHGNGIGSVEVYCLNETPECDEGPFLKEERSLIKTIAEQLGKLSDRKLMEDEREVIIDLLGTINSANNLHGLMKNVMLLIKDWTGCDAVGIRLKEGHDFPYYEVSGFSAEHILVENNLCARDDRGELIRDDVGNPVLECMCGNIIRGRFDPSRPFFTEYGSFWSNCTTELLASTTEEDRLGRTRDTCNGEGYESVMLIPLKYGNEIVGLLQINDKRRDFFTAESRSQLERMAGSVAIAIAQRHTQAELLKSHGELVKAQETAHLGSYEWDADTGEITWSDEMYRLFGVDPEQFGRAITFEDVIKFVHPDDGPKIRENTKRILEEGTSLPIEYRVVHPDGTERILLEKVEAIVDGGGKSNTVTGTVQDITERKRIEEQLRQSQLLASLGEMTAGIAHEVNNPLSAILLYSELINQAGFSPGARKDLKVIHSEAKRASNIMRDLLTYSRKEEPVARQMNLHRTIRKVIAMRRYQERIRNIDMAVELVDGPLRVLGNAAQLTRLFMNLIMNAEEAVEKSADKKIVIATEQFGAWVRVSITDSGVGIPAENLTRVFVPFYTTKAIGKGTGLGLATCHGIVTAHGGLIRAENNEMGGATFIVELPVAGKAK